MKNWHPLTKLTLIAGGGAVIALVMTGENESPTGASAALPQAPSLRAVAVRNEQVSAPLALPVPSHEDVTEMVERPLFTPSRRPPPVLAPVAVETEAVAAEPSEPLVPEPEVAFVGSMVRNGETLAIVTIGFDGEVASLGIGAEVDGWTVLDIDSDVLVLGLDDRRLEYSIFQ